MEEGQEPGFDKINVYLENDSDAWLNTSGTFYNGILHDGEGQASTYDDGTPIETGADGNLFQDM